MPLRPGLCVYRPALPGDDPKVNFENALRAGRSPAVQHFLNPRGLQKEVPPPAFQKRDAIFIANNLVMSRVKVRRRNGELGGLLKP